MEHGFIKLGLADGIHKLILWRRESASPIAPVRQVVVERRWLAGDHTAGRATGGFSREGPSRTAQPRSLIALPPTWMNDVISMEAPWRGKGPPGEGTSTPPNPSPDPTPRAQGEEREGKRMRVDLFLHQGAKTG